MKRMSAFAACAAVAFALVSPPVLAQPAPGGVQGQIRKDLRAGNIRSIREIERRVLPMMSGMQYLGPEYDPAAIAFRLKFIRDGRVVFVDVDARTGAIMGQSR